jgi:hypothetical protein
MRGRSPHASRRYRTSAAAKPLPRLARRLLSKRDTDMCGDGRPSDHPIERLLLAFTTAVPVGHLPRLIRTHHSTLALLSNISC